MANNGWIKIHRSIFDNPWMNNADVLGTWVYILLNVAYQPTDVVFEGKRITLAPGQGLFKIRQMAKILGVSHSKLNRIITLFKSETQIETQTTPRNTLITVVNWGKYQANETQNETQVEHNWNTTGTQVEHLPIIKRNKEIKNKRIYGEYQNVKLTDEELEKLKNEFPVDWQERIENVSAYCASHGKTYKDYLATIRNWARKDRPRIVAKNDVQSGLAQALQILGEQNG